MKITSCAFLGHENFNYIPYEYNIQQIIRELLECGVREFYSCSNGSFDTFCIMILQEMCMKYSDIRLIHVCYTKKELVTMTDCIISGVKYLCGSAKRANSYAKKLYRSVFNVVDGTAYCDYKLQIIKAEKAGLIEEMSHEEKDALFAKIMARIKSE